MHPSGGAPLVSVLPENALPMCPSWVFPHLCVCPPLCTPYVGAPLVGALSCGCALLYVPLLWVPPPPLWVCPAICTPSVGAPLWVCPPICTPAVGAPFCTSCLELKGGWVGVLVVF